MTHPRHQRGVALLIVLMIVALVVIIATNMGTRLQLQVQRAINIKDSNQAYWYALGAEAFASKSIGKILEETADKIVITQPWAQSFSYPLENGTIDAQLEDAQSCFNLNALAKSDNSDQQSNAPTPNTPSNANAGGKNANNKKPGNKANRRNGRNPEVSETMDAFAKMLEASGDSIDNYTAETVRDSLADWLDEDSRMRTYGAEDSEYESREFPYLAANNLMTNQSELRLVNGVSPAWLNAILPLICVIPGQKDLAINVNTLTEERAAVLAGTAGISLQQAKSLISNRPADGWDDINDFLSEPSIVAQNLSDAQRAWFTITTQYFMLHTKSRYNEATFSLSTLFKAQNGNVEPIRREFGGIE